MITIWSGRPGRRRRARHRRPAGAAGPAGRPGRRRRRAVHPDRRGRPAVRCGSRHGRAPSGSVRATRTVTFGAYKPGHLIEPAASRAGLIELVDIRARPLPYAARAGRVGGRRRRRALADAGTDAATSTPAGGRASTPAPMPTRGRGCCRPSGAVYGGQGWSATSGRGGRRRSSAESLPTSSSVRGRGAPAGGFRLGRPGRRRPRDRPV